MASRQKAARIPQSGAGKGEEKMTGAIILIVLALSTAWLIWALEHAPELPWHE
jgi:hypothetical protein